MNRRLGMSLAVSGMLLLVAAATRAQDVPPPPPPFGGPMELLGFEGGHAGHNVKGAPYSATATSETIQTLALEDGTTTKIHRTTQSLLYRDSQGRSRREVTLSGFGPLAASGTAHKLVTIADPVAGEHYVVDDEHQMVHKMSLRSHGGNASGATAAGVFPEKMKAQMQAEEPSGAVKKESHSTSLTVNVNGVSASVSTEYTKITRTIRPGEIGNETAMQVVSERWYSPELQIVVKSTRSDPRFGTTTYTVSNIQTTGPDPWPDPSLFTIPAGYTVKEGGPGPNMMYRHGFGKEVLPPPPPPNN
jgi:Spy/CpxP family protein refolding chaperone